LRSRDAALAPGIGWFVVVLAMLFLPRPGGDIIVPESGGDAIAFLILGFFGIFVAGFAAARIVPRRGATPPADSRR
jgi:drug/metabolite transporter (DMT)-like permease